MIGSQETLPTCYRTIQRCIPKYRQNNKALPRTFSNLMFEGKTNAVLHLLTEQHRGSILPLNSIVPSNGSEFHTVLDILKNKHPAGQAVHPNTIIQPHANLPNTHPVIFDRIDASAIRSAALHTKGAAGPSGIDAHGWRMCTTFKSVSSNLCHSLALLARRLCTEFVDPHSLAPLMACRLIALDKNPGVHPIGIREVVRRIIAKAILFVIWEDIQEVAGSVKLCTGQVTGAEAAVHAMSHSFMADDTEAVLLGDASNTFNLLNRKTTLLNIRSLCPSFATILINTYREETQLFVDGSTLYSQERTTQGDPLVMPMCALAILPLIYRVSQSVKQVWYTDDATATGNIQSLHTWWDDLATIGPALGYHVNASKTWLVTKESHYATAVAAFQDTAVNITADGKPHLGAAIGTMAHTNQYVIQKVAQWSKELKALSSVASTQPHAAYAAFTHGMVSKWQYLSRTIPNIGDQLQPLEDIIRTQLIPALTRRAAPNENERILLALPAKAWWSGHH